jgi:acid phosphatase
MKSKDPHRPSATAPEQPTETTQPGSAAGVKNPRRRRMLEGIAALGVSAAAYGDPVLAAARQADTLHTDALLKRHVKTIVVIYAENRSFNNLYGNFPGVANPLSDVPEHRYSQVDRDGLTRMNTLPKIWGGLVPVAQTIDNKTYQIGENDISGLPNAPFKISDAQGQLLPESVVTQDLWHRFYQNQMQINGGRNDQFVAWADSGALVMGHYANTAENLRLAQLAREYTICDNFFMGAFGGSFLNHIVLISGAPPVYPDAANSPAKNKIAVLEGDSPQGTRLKVADHSPRSALDGVPKFVNDGAITPDGYAVNTMQAPYQPSSVPPPKGGDPRYADPANANTLPPQTYATIGDRLSQRGVDWAWYAGAWQAALDGGNHSPVPNFQTHHQPFNYFANYAPGTAARARHLRDAGLGDTVQTNLFLADAAAGRLPPVTFYKPQGNLNMHAGYADVASGDQHIAHVVEQLRQGPQWQDMVIVITHDENGGWWDHVAPPLADRWGPGSRVPALVISPYARRGYVDHTTYDTQSILRFISRVHDLPPLEGVAARDRALREANREPFGDLTAALDLERQQA